PWIPYFLPRTRATVAPMSAGLLTVVMPAASIAFIFSAAVPLPPAMMAPAWPMRRPGGAVWPQMKPTTGFITCCFTKAAASSSAVPPISPIIMIDVVDVARHDADLGLTRRDQAGTVGADQPAGGPGEEGLHPHHVGHRHTLGDAHDQRHAGVGGLHDRVGGRGRRHEDQGA